MKAGSLAGHHAAHRGYGIAKRRLAELDDVADKVYTRDLFGGD